MDIERWKAGITEFKTVTARSMVLALELSQAALDHYADTGDTIRCQELLEAMAENYNRRAAYTTWLATFCPVKTEQGKLVKDAKKAGEIWPDWQGQPGGGLMVIGPITADMIVKAKAKSFWDFVPDAKPIIVEATDVISTLRSSINKLRNAKHQPTPEALQAMAEAEAALLPVATAVAQRAAVAAVQKDFVHKEEAA
jgi:hypothetical protein